MTRYRDLEAIEARLAKIQAQIEAAITKSRARQQRLAERADAQLARWEARAKEGEK